MPRLAASRSKEVPLRRQHSKLFIARSILSPKPYTLNANLVPKRGVEGLELAFNTTANHELRNCKSIFRKPLAPVKHTTLNPLNRRP